MDSAAPSPGWKRRVQITTLKPTASGGAGAAGPTGNGRPTAVPSLALRGATAGGPVALGGGASGRFGQVLDYPSVLGRLVEGSKT